MKTYFYVYNAKCEKYVLRNFYNYEKRDVGVCFEEKKNEQIKCSESQHHVLTTWDNISTQWIKVVSIGS